LYKYCFNPPLAVVIRNKPFVNSCVVVIGRASDQGRIQDFGWGRGSLQAAGRAQKAHELRLRMRRMGEEGGGVMVRVSSLPLGERSTVCGELVIFPEIFFNFGVSKCVFWCILWPFWVLIALQHLHC